MNRRSARGALLLAGAAALAVATPAQAQVGGKGFLFQEPRWTFAIRGGFDRASASGGLFEFVTDELTLERKDFSGLHLAADLALRIMPRVDLAIGVTHAGSTTPSESRKFVGTDDLPILQTTKFARTAVTGSLKGYLLPRGQTIGSLAWIPSRFSPYVGAGGGMMQYRFSQEGEFVDVLSPDLDIFADKMSSRGWTPTAHGMAGVDVSLTPHLGVTTEARYSWAKGPLETGPRAAYGDFSRIDLSGWSATMGFHVRF